jgi:uncharacterized protein YndB with AHSA1/START domain
MSQGTKAIIVEYELPHSPAKVWRALTEPELVTAWLMENDLVAEVGRRFTFRGHPVGEWDGIVHCEVLVVDAPKRFVYSWRGGRGSSTLDTMVSWTLEPTSTGTRLRLEHSGFLPMNTQAFEAMSKGWHGHLAQRISRLLEKTIESSVPGSTKAQA